MGDDYITQEEAHRRPRINAEVIIGHLLLEIEWAKDRAQRKISTLKNVQKIKKASEEVDKIVKTLREYDLNAAGELVEVSFMLKRFA